MISEDVFRLVMEKAREVPRTIYIARQEDEYEEDEYENRLVCGYFDTYEKARDCIRSQSMLFDPHYEILEFDIEAFSRYIDEGWTFIKKVSKERSFPDTPGYFEAQQMKFMREAPIAEAEKMVKAFHSIFAKASGNGLQGLDEMLQKRKDAESKKDLPYFNIVPAPIYS